MHAPLPKVRSTAFSALGPLELGSIRIEVPIIMAPMAGVSEAPYRTIALEMGAGLAPTELVSAKGLQYQNARTEGYLRHDPATERQLSVQIFGGDPEAMALAAEKVIERGAKIVDINMGCPVKKVTRNGAGSALMTDPGRAASIVAAIRTRVGDDVPVTAKIRGGWDQNSRNAAEVGRALEDAGAAAVAIHPRTRTQGYSGSADWDLIAELADSVSVPVIANGDIVDAASAERVVSQTGCAAVMIGRAALGNPWIFTQLRAAYLGEPLPEEPNAAARTEMILRHFRDHLVHTGDEDRGIKKFRQHLIWYSRGMRGGSVFRERAMHLTERGQVEDLVHEFFMKTQLTHADEAPVYDERQAFG